MVLSVTCSQALGSLLSYFNFFSLILSFTSLYKKSFPDLTTAFKSYWINIIEIQCAVCSFSIINEYIKQDQLPSLLSYFLICRPQPAIIPVNRTYIKSNLERCPLKMTNFSFVIPNACFLCSPLLTQKLRMFSWAERNSEKYKIE